jgi:hypothetical protein
MIKKIFVFIASILSIGALASAASAQSVTRGYGSDQVLQRGMIVGLSKSGANKIEAIDITRLTTILGVVVSANDSPITISDSLQHIFVTTSGRYDVLVSDQQGPIKVSDYITLSALGGVGMKATDQESNILGRAAASFDGKTNVLSSTVLSSNNGKQRAVNLARISVDIEIAKNPLSKNGNGAPVLLNQISTAIVGKAVSATRLYLASIVLIIGLIVAGSVLYAGVRGSIISIGRNPLSRRSILRSMVGVALTSIVLFLVSIMSVYLLLRF